MTKHENITVCAILCYRRLYEDFEPDMYSFEDDIREYCREEGSFTDDQLAYIRSEYCETDIFKEAEEDYYKNVSYAIIHGYEAILAEVLSDFNIETTAETGLDFEFSYSDKTIQEVKKFIAENDSAWALYLKNRYTSYDGFWSHYDNTPDSDDWKDIEKCLEHEHKASAVLDFIAKRLTNDQLDYELYYFNESWLYVNIEKMIEELKTDISYPELTDDDIKDIDNRQFYKQLAENNLRLFEATG